ncbi:hypothetical protein BDY21DRAFT_279073 [Lineolata rhizophorae]|uniref:SH3 domain-containing protein n=1 Tax=Lineolata rhizophorae TaxID=578093 RepID=A0A6A6PC19_9PEZI|nr:hypothetical protein BDY21DRAFT_279073 [Lineolata rhizophorae]
MAQNCVSLAGSTACPAFNSSSVSISSEVTGLFPFLSFVDDVESFDSRLREYVATDFTQLRYQQLIGCSDIDLTNATELYARYTISTLCNAIVQNSIDDCDLSGNETRPLCADTCAQQAISEQEISSTPELCGDPGPNALRQIRADFTNCALPADSLSGTCIDGVDNEPDDCGYQDNLSGLCLFCSESTANGTDTCCYNANVEDRCEGVTLPTPTSMTPLFPSSTSTAAPSSTSSSESTAAAAAASGGSGLSGNVIAGIVVGVVLGTALIVGILIACIFYRRRRRGSKQGSVLNQPSPSRQGGAPPPMSFDGSRQPQHFEVMPGGRVVGMSALEGSSASDRNGSPMGGLETAYRHSSSDEYDTPDSQRNNFGLVGGPLPKRQGSLSSHGEMNDSSSPHSGSGNEQFSSPEGVASGQSEQLQFFKDYYSQDEIRAGDVVATLWAYQPRANDEFELERGDMLKVVGIWDDGWATGVRVSERADEWDARRNPQRDSGVSNGSRRQDDDNNGGGGQVVDGEIKAFPLVCVCLPQHWRKTIEGDENGPSGGPGSP